MSGRDAHGDQFELVFVGAGASRRRAWSIKCGCGREDQIQDATSSLLPTEVIAKKFAQRGWVVGHRRHVCSACLEAERTGRRKGAAVKRAAAAKTKAGDKPMNDTAQDRRQTVVSDPPPRPSREQRRQIHETIDANWSVKSDCYAAKNSDKQIAESLGVPWAWVAEVRDAAFGPADVNEAHLAGVVQLDDLILRGEALEERAMALAADVESWKRDAQALRKAARA